jgi:hypothetical protein
MLVKITCINLHVNGGVVFTVTTRGLSHETVQNDGLIYMACSAALMELRTVGVKTSLQLIVISSIL